MQKLGIANRGIRGIVESRLGIYINIDIKVDLA